MILLDHDDRPQTPQERRRGEALVIIAVALGYTALLGWLL